MKRKVIIMTCAIIGLMSITALCNEDIQGSIADMMQPMFEEETDICNEKCTEDEFEAEMDFNFDIEILPPKELSTEVLFEIEEIPEEFSLDCVETVFSDVCTLMAESDFEASDEMQIKNSLISTSVNYAMTPSELNHIKELFEEGLDLEKVLEIYEFLRWTSCDYTYIEQIYNEGIQNSDRENWVYDAYDTFFNRTDDMLSVEDVAYYVSQGVSVEEIAGAYELSFAGKKTTKAMLTERMEGKTWNEISATSLSKNPEEVINAPEMTIDEVMTFRNFSVRQRKEFSELTDIQNGKVTLNEDALHFERSNRIEKDRLMAKHNVEPIVPVAEEKRIEYSNELPETLITEQELEEDLIPLEEPEVE